MASRIVVFGATGYTGRLVAEQLVAAGARPVLAGRNPERLAALADALGGLETATADVMRQNSVFALLEAGDVMVSTVGPFTKWGEPAVRAAIAAGGTYLDSTGEPAFIRRVFEEFDGPARRGGAKLLTAMGYDFVPGSLAGGLALGEAGEEAVRVDIGYYALGPVPRDFASAGTQASLVQVLLAPAFAWRDGRLATERNAARIRSFRVRDRERKALSVGGAEHIALPAAYPRVRDVNVYLGWFGPLSRALQLTSPGAVLVGRLPGVRGAVRAAGERLVRMVPSRQPGDSADTLSWVVAAAYDRSGRQLSEIHLRGVDPYVFTAAILAWGARRAASTGIEGSGSLGPVAAFGLEALREGCEEAGLERVPAGSGG